MSVLIKDMEKPKSCFEIIDGDFEYCPFVNTDDDCVLLLKKGICNAKWKEQYSKCPLVEVPEPCKDAVSRADVFDMLDMYPFTEYGEYETAREIVKRLPSVEPKPDQYEDVLKKIKNASFVGSDGLDYVETRQALDALKDTIGVTLHVTKISKHCSDFSDLDEVIECEDAVSRKAVYEAMIEKGQRSRRYRLGETWELNGTEIREALDTVPSVTPKCGSKMKERRADESD